MAAESKIEIRTTCVLKYIYKPPNPNLVSISASQNSCTFLWVSDAL